MVIVSVADRLHGTAPGDAAALVKAGVDAPGLGLAVPADPLPGEPLEALGEPLAEPLEALGEPLASVGDDGLDGP